ncbi:hypothetical protein STAQ_43890 [Allostella sp. ATCC 35155]|nr:hypothetical protein STAQ_43890 [Stella sp. ATCC 35155]
MSRGRVRLADLAKGGGQIDKAKVDATTEEDIERHMAEDGEPPGGYEPRPIPDLKALRQRLGMSQGTFAAALALPVSTVRNWEQGRTYPDAPAITLLRILQGAPEAAFRALGVTIGGPGGAPQAGPPRKAA